MKRLALALILAAVLGCSKDQSPLGRDFYALQSIAGVVLPAPYAPNASYNGLLVADSIAFHEDGTGYRHWVYREENSTDDVSLEDGFNWTRDGNSIAITFLCPPAASCIAGPHFVGTIDEVSLTITDSKVTRQPLVYQRSGIERLERRTRRLK
jgi:hypothetical protein